MSTMTTQSLSADATRWDDEYRSGRWSYLADPEQSPRYAVIAEWCRRFSTSATILDAGCGEGLLLDYIRPGSYAMYRGIDFAPAAVAQARLRIVDPARQQVECLSFEDFNPRALAPDIVVFNESLYCCSDPLTVFRRYQEAVGAGLIVLSITILQNVVASLLERMYEEDVVASLTITDRQRAKGWRLLAVCAGRPT